MKLYLIAYYVTKVFEHWLFAFLRQTFLCRDGDGDVQMQI